MREKVKEIPEKFKVFWDKYTSKQKTIVIANMCGSHSQRSCGMACFETYMVKVSGV